MQTTKLFVAALLALTVVGSTVTWEKRKESPPDVLETPVEKLSIVLPFSSAVSVTPKFPEWWRDVEGKKWEVDLFRALNQELTVGSTYVGLGEWVGAASLFALQRAKKAVLVEPDPTAYNILAENVEANDYFKVAYLEADCISDFDGPAVMYGSGASVSSLVKGFPWLSSAPSFDVHCTILSSLFAKYGVSTDEPVFLKIDVEGQLLGQCSRCYVAILC